MENVLLSALFGLLIFCFIVIWQMYKSLGKQISMSENLQLKKGEKRLEALIENGLDCVVIISPEGKAMYVSRSIKNILGYTPDELMNIDIRALIHPDDLAGSEEALVRTIQFPGIPIQGHTSRVKHKNGTWRWIEPVVTNLMHDPAINGIVDNFRDVTDRIKAEEELKKTNERFRLATKGSKLGIWDHDMVENKLIWDEAMYKIYDVSEATFDLNSHTWLTLIHEDDRPLLQLQVEKILMDGVSLDLEFRIVRPDLSIRFIRSMAQIYHDDAGKPVRIVGTNIDITSSKEYEQTLKQIIFDISHIIRQPVTNILGLSNLIETANLNEDDLKQLAVHMKEAARNLDDFTTSITHTYLKKKMSMGDLLEQNK